MGPCASSWVRRKLGACFETTTVPLVGIDQPPHRRQQGCLMWGCDKRQKRVRGRGLHQARGWARGGRFVPRAGRPNQTLRLPLRRPRQQCPLRLALPLRALPLGWRWTPWALQPGSAAGHGQMEARGPRQGHERGQRRPSWPETLALAAANALHRPASHESADGPFAAHSPGQRRGSCALVV